MNIRLRVPALPGFSDFARSIEEWLRRLAEPPVYTVATLPDPTINTGRTVFVSDEAGGATLAFSDGADWRRAQDRNVVS